jgi:hypothetical protein
MARGAAESVPRSARSGVCCGVSMRTWQRRSASLKSAYRHGPGGILLEDAQFGFCLVAVNSEQWLDQSLKSNTEAAWVIRLRWLMGSYKTCTMRDSQRLWIGARWCTPVHKRQTENPALVTVVLWISSTVITGTRTNSFALHFNRNPQSQCARLTFNQTGSWLQSPSIGIKQLHCETWCWQTARILTMSYWLHCWRLRTLDLVDVLLLPKHRQMGMINCFTVVYQVCSTNQLQWARTLLITGKECIPNMWLHVNQNNNLNISMSWGYSAQFASYTSLLICLLLDLLGSDH